MAVSPSKTHWSGTNNFYFTSKTGHTFNATCDCEKCK